MTPGLFFGLMLSGAIVAYATRASGMMRTVLAMAACSAIGLIWRLVIVPDSEWPWLTYAAIDACAAAIIIRHPANRWQGWVGLCFLIQFAMNVGYGVAFLNEGYSYDAAILAWEVTGWITNLKLFFLGAWGGLSLLGLGRRRSHILYHSAPHFNRDGDAR